MKADRHLPKQVGYSSCTDSALHLDRQETREMPVHLLDLPIDDKMLGRSIKIDPRRLLYVRQQAARARWKRRVVTIL